MSGSEQYLSTMYGGWLIDFVVFYTIIELTVHWPVGYILEDCVDIEDMKEGLVPYFHGENKGVIYVLDLQTRKWQFIEHDKSKLKEFPPYGPGMRLVRIGNLLVQIGGKYRLGYRKAGQQGWVLKIPTRVSWERERLLWIGYLKNYNNEKCWFGTVPKDIVRLIVSFFYQASVYDEAAFQSKILQ